MHPAGLFCTNLKKAVDNSLFSWYNNTRRQGRHTSYGGLAQLGERLHGMQEVTGSIPVISTRKKSIAQKCVVLFSLTPNERGLSSPGRAPCMDCKRVTVITTAR